MQNYPRKLLLSDWNVMMMHSLKLMFSVSGLLMLMGITIIGGGGIYLIMGQVTMQGLGYFIIQPAVFTVYLVCLIARHRSGNPRLSVGKEVRNIFLNALIGIFVTIIMLCILWMLRIYVPTANASEFQPSYATVSSSLTPETFSPRSVDFGSVFPVMFNMYSIATFTMMGLLPFIGILIAALVNCDAPLHRNLGLLCRGLLRNTATMMLFSIFSFFLMSLWSYIALKGEWLIFVSVIPLSFLSVFSYVIAEQIFLPEKRLLKKGATTCLNPPARF